MQGSPDCPKCNGTGNRSLGFMPYVACYQGGGEKIWTLKDWGQRDGHPRRICVPTWPGGYSTRALIVISDKSIQSSERVKEGRFWWADVTSGRISNDGRIYYKRKHIAGELYIFELHES